MMLMGDKKKLATIIVGKMKNKKPDFVEEFGAEKTEVNPEKPEVDNSSGMDMASEDLITGINEKNAKMVTSALKAFMDLMETEEETEE